MTLGEIPLDTVKTRAMTCLTGPIRYFSFPSDHTLTPFAMLLTVCYSQNSLDQCPMPINVDHNSGIDPNVDKFQSVISIERHFRQSVFVLFFRDLGIWISDARFRFWNQNQKSLKCWDGNQGIPGILPHWFGLVPYEKKLCRVLRMTTSSIQRTILARKGSI